MPRLGRPKHGGFPRIKNTQNKEENATMLKKLVKDGSRVKFEMDNPIKTSLPHIYLPRLHRQKTDKDPETELGTALQHLADLTDIDAEGELALKLARSEAKELMMKINKCMRTEKNGFEFRSPVLVDCYPHWKQSNMEVAYLIPVILPRIILRFQQPGCVVVELPNKTELHTPSEESSNKSENGTPQVDFDKLRAKDGMHLSLKKTYITFAKLIKRILKLGGVVAERVKVGHCESGYYLTVDLKNYGWSGWKLQIIPAIYIKTNMFLIPKIFFTGESVPSDIHWRISWIVREMEILSCISLTDKGSRLRALRVVCKLCQTDWRLADLTSYHVQTALLYDMDHHVDSSPRWQRFTLEMCVKSLLGRLLAHVRRGSLPHFLIEGIDLFELVNPRKLTLWKSALERLTSCDGALLSLTRRATLGQKQTELSFPKLIDV